MNFSDWRNRLKAGETITRKVHGNSMTPLIQSGQSVTLAPITNKKTLGRGDVVFCKVRGHYYVHKIYRVGTSKGRAAFLIGNNHGYMNGWTTMIYGKVIKIED